MNKLQRLLSVVSSPHLRPKASIYRRPLSTSGRLWYFPSPCPTPPQTERLRFFSSSTDSFIALSASQWNRQVRDFLKSLSDVADYSMDQKAHLLKQALHMLDDLSLVTRQQKAEGDLHLHNNIDDTPNDVSLDTKLALKLLDAVVEMDQEMHSIELSPNACDKVLNVILQLWRQRVVSDPSLPSPSQMLSKLDDYRTCAYASFATVQPDVQSFNILLAAAGSLGELDSCRQIYQWMRTEGIVDRSVRPDRITLRNMFQAILKSNKGVEAAEECDRLVADYLAQSNQDTTAIQQSLIHAWAVADPWQAREYLQLLANHHLEHGTIMDRPVPETVDWNRVISAFAIQHSKPQLAKDLLQSFWRFSATLQDRLHFQIQQQQQKPTLFDIPQPDLYSYNSILEGWARLNNNVEADKIFTMLIESEHLRPNIVTYTSAIKANGGDLDRVDQLAQDCLQAYRDGDIAVLDQVFFQAWLQTCVQATIEGSGNAAIVVAQRILFKIMPEFEISPNIDLFGSLLQCYLIQDDLEGATQCLLKHVEEMGETTIVRWTSELSKKGDIQLSSFVDRIRGKEPKTLLQVLLEDGQMQSSSALEQLLTNLSAERGLEALQWIPLENRTPACFARVMRALTQEGNAEGVENLFSIVKADVVSKWNRMVDSSPASVDPEALRDMYTSLIVAWSKQENMERTKHWWDTWMQDHDVITVAPPTRAAQTAVLSCFGAVHQPNQAQQFWEDLQVLHQNDQLPEAPDMVMFNLVLKAWILAANGVKAQAFLEMAQSRYGVVPDGISYNSVVQAHVKSRQLDKAIEYVRSHIRDRRNSTTDFPNLATFRSILTGWSLHRQDYSLAGRQSALIFAWMKDLHTQGILQEDPEQDSATRNLLTKTWRRHRKSLNKKDDPLVQS